MNSQFSASSSANTNGFAMVLPSISPSGQPMLVTSGIGPSSGGNTSHLRLAAQHKNMFRSRQQQLQHQIAQLQQQHQQQRKQKSHQQQLQRQLSNSASLLLMQSQLNAAAAANSNLLRSFNSSSTAAMLSNSNEVLQLNRQLLEFLTQIKHTFALLEKKIRGRQHLIDIDLKEAFLNQLECIYECLISNDMQLREQRQQKLNAMVMASLRNQRLDVRNSSTGTSSKAISGTVVAEEDYNDEDDITSELLLQSDDHDTGIGQYTDELEMDAGLEDAAEEEEEEDQSSLFSNDLNNNHILGQNHNSLLNKSFGQLPLLPTSKAKRAASTRSTFGQLESGTSIWPDYELNTSQKIQQQLASLASPLLDYSSLFDLGAAAKLSNNRKTNGSSRATSASQSSRTKAGSNKLPNPSIASSLASLGSISSMSNMAKIASLTAGGAATISNESETPSHHPSACNLNSNDSDHLVVSVNPSELLDERLSEKSKPSELSAFRDQSDDISFSGQLKYLNQSQFDPQVSSTAVTTPIRSSNAVSTGATTPTTAKSTRRSNSSSGESKSSKSKRRSSEEKGESHVRPKALETEPSMAKIASSAAAYLASEEFDSDDKNGFLGKKCVCPYCPQTFTQRNSLNRHIRSHTGERPFPCEFCGKCFSDKQRLLIHTRIHTGEKPFSCSICYRKFTQKSTVKRHLIVHFGHSSGKADEARAKQFAKAKSKELNELILCSLKPIPKPGEPEPEMPVKTGLSPAAAKLLRQSVNNNLRRPPPLQRIPKQNAGKSLLDHQRKEGPASSNGFLRSPSAGLKRPKLEKIGRKSLSLPEDEDDGGDAGDEFEGDNDDDFKNVDLSESGGDMNHMSQEFEADDDEEEDEVEDEEEDEDEMMDEEEDEDTPDHQLDQLQIKEGDKNDDDKVKSQLEIFDGKDNLLKEEKETDNADEIVS